MPRVEANTLKGLILSLDRRKIPQPQVLDGRNFFVDIDGPRSGFGRTEIAHDAFANPAFVQTFATDADTNSWFFFRDAILRPDIINDRFIPVNVFSPADVDYPWFSALVGGKTYFAKRGIGLIEHDPVAGTWKAVDGTNYGTGIPANIVACAEAAGRLIVVAEGLVAWSNIDDGSQMLTSTATGAGFQALSKVGSFSLDSVLGVYRTPEGFMTFTKNGIMRSQTVTGAIPFRHDRLNFKNVPLNAFCIAQTTDDTLVFLTQQGFFATNGGQVEDWQPLMSEYLRLSVLPGLPNFDNGTIKLQFVDVRGWMFVSISDTGQPSVYNRAFVWSNKSNEWGRFDRLHAGIVEIVLNAGLFIGTNLGYIDPAGNGYIFSFESSDVIFPELSAFDVRVQGDVQYDARMEDGIAKMPTVWYLRTEDFSAFPGVGIFETDSVRQQAQSPELSELILGTIEPSSVFVDGGISRMATGQAWGTGIVHLQLAVKQLALSALDAWIEVGVFRMILEEDMGEYSTITSAMVGMLDAETLGVSFDDWLLDYSSAVFEDWMLLEGAEDWGIASASGSVYSVKLQSSLDAFSPVEGMDKTLDRIRADGKTQIFSAYSTGIYHALRIDAALPGQSFHLKSLELSGFPAGVAI